MAVKRGLISHSHCLLFGRVQLLVRSGRCWQSLSPGCRLCVHLQHTGHRGIHKQHKHLYPHTSFPKSSPPLPFPKSKSLTHFKVNFYTTFKSSLDGEPKAQWPRTHLRLFLGLHEVVWMWRGGESWGSSCITSVVGRGLAVGKRSSHRSLCIPVAACPGWLPSYCDAPSPLPSTSPTPCVYIMT